MAKRKRADATRARASEAAMARRVDERAAVDWRVWGIVGLAVIGVLVGVVAVAVAFSGGAGGGTTVGTLMPDARAVHIAEGEPGSGYTSVPASSGQHWGSASCPTGWGVHELAVPQECALHNLEHGGIVIWYQADQLPAEAVGQLTEWGRRQVQGDRFKVIVSPWSGDDFGHPIAAVAWRILLYQDALDLDQLDDFVTDHYQGRYAPEPNAGPGRPTT